MSVEQGFVLVEAVVQLSQVVEHIAQGEFSGGRRLLAKRAQRFGVTIWGILDF